MSQVNGFSILLCCYNSVSRLAPTMQHLAALKVPANFAIELLLIDNASTDNTADFALEAWRKLGARFKMKIHREEKPGLSAARAKGFQCASYEFMLMCDDDNWLAPDYLLQAAPLLENPAVAGLGGYGIPEADVPLPDWFAAFSKSFALGPQASATGPVPGRRAYLYGAGCILRKSALYKVFETGFQSRLQDRKGKSYSSGGDVELCYALVLAGFELWYCEKMIFRHYLPEKRLLWEDFLQLKTGITASFATFLSYQFFIKKKNTGILFFLHHYFRQIRDKSICFYKHSKAQRKYSSFRKTEIKSTAIATIAAREQHTTDNSLQKNQSQEAGDHLMLLYTYEMDTLICKQQLKALLFQPAKIWRDYFYVSRYIKAIRQLQ